MNNPLRELIKRFPRLFSKDLPDKLPIDRIVYEAVIIVVTLQEMPILNFELYPRVCQLCSILKPFVAYSLAPLPVLSTRADQSGLAEVLKEAMPVISNLGCRAILVRGTVYCGVVGGPKTTSFSVTGQGVTKAIVAAMTLPLMYSWMDDGIASILGGVEDAGHSDSSTFHCWEPAVIKSKK